MNEQHFYSEIKAHLCLRTNKTNKPEMIYLVIRIDGKQYKLSCGVKVYPKQWHKGVAEESNLISKRDNVNNKIVNEKISEVLDSFSKFKQHLCTCDCEGLDMGKLLRSYIYKDSKMVKNINGKNVVTLIREAYEEYYSINNPNVKESSVKQNKSILKHYVKFIEGLGRERQKEAFTRNGFLLWRKHILDKVNNVNEKFGVITANNYGQLIANLINNVLYNKHNLNVEKVYWAALKDTREKQEVGHFELFPEELSKIKELVFDARKANGTIKREDAKNEQYRDLFILQTLCGLRVSDLKKLIEEDYRIDEEEGQLYYIIETKKKGSTAYVMQTEELDRYLKIVRNSEVRQFKEQYYNCRIKTICERACLNRVIERKDSTGKDTVCKPLYEVVTSHCARYTFVRQKYQEGYTEMEIAKMVGHRDDTMVREVYNKKVDRDYMHNINLGRVRVEGIHKGQL